MQVISITNTKANRIENRLADGSIIVNSIRSKGNDVTPPISSLQTKNLEPYEIDSRFYTYSKEVANSDMTL